MGDVTVPYSAGESAPFVQASSVPKRRVDWLWQGYLPLGELVLIDGDPGLGKSTLVYDLAARLTSGYAMPDGTPGPGASGAVIVSAEDDPSCVIVPRLEAAGADLSRIALPPPDADLLLDEASLARIEDAVSTYGARLVTIDPLMAFMPAGVDTHRDPDVRRLLRKVSGLAQRTNATVLLVRHPNKAEGMSALHRGGGSIGIIGAARAGFLLARNPKGGSNGRVFAPLKMNLAVEPPALAIEVISDPSGEQPVLLWGGEVEMNADDLVRSPTRSRSPKRDHAGDFLVEILSDGPKLTSDIMEFAAEEGISEKTLRRAAGVLGIETSRTGFGADGFHEWSLPDPPELAKDATSLVPVATTTEGALQ